MSTDRLQRITIEPGKCGGKPCIRHLLITVYDVLDWLAQGMSEADIVTEHPELTVEDIRAALAYAANREHHLAARSIRAMRGSLKGIDTDVPREADRV